jgi:hypothetical protein
LVIHREGGYPQRKISISKKIHNLGAKNALDFKKIWRVNQRKVGADPEESGGLDPSSWAARSEKRGGIPIQSKRAALRLMQRFGRSNRASSHRWVESRGRAFGRTLQVGQHAIHARLALLGAGQRIPALGS